ncbi:hypothetical protein [Paenibacillus piri]|nr:hypothetical protein [Paenibacillus piri]
MLTYCLLALAALFVLNQWVRFSKMKRTALPLESVDAEFHSRLNNGEKP